MLQTKIADFSFSNCLMNASGVWCRTEAELDELIKSSASTFVTKSSTLEFREGNPEPRYVDLELGSINSMGLPNLGIDFYLNYSIKNNQKENFLSVAGLTREENLEMLEKVQNSEFSGLLELNLSCPNVIGKPQVGYDFDATKSLLEEVFSVYKKPLGVKLPPYFDIVHFQQIAEILNQFPLKFVTCVNSIGNGLFIDTDSEKVVIKPKNGFGGIGGKYIKPTALANVRQFYTLLNPEIKVIGCGGIENGKDAFEHILCGASMLQVGTQLMKEGMSAFDRIEKELREIMKQKGYSTIEDFKGKLQSL
ncbi:MAG: dihydroorotate oxidase [Flavobacteriales bacterium]|nr:dihydroorotate oxidase [Flavobacteriales bacterium]